MDCHSWTAIHGWPIHAGAYATLGARAQQQPRELARPDVAEVLQSVTLVQVYCTPDPSLCGYQFF